MFYPYSLRFRHNSRRMRRRGYPCITVDDIFYCHAIRRHGVIYRKLEGRPLDRLLCSKDATAHRVYVEYAVLLARLHADRIYFRSVHPGNVLLMADGSYGLIDVGDMRFPLLPLSIDQRRRNFRHLLRSIEFREALKYHRGDNFIDAYLAAARLPAASRQALRGRLVGDFDRARKIRDLPHPSRLE